MEHFKSFTEFESFVKQTRDEYLNKTANHLFAHANVDRFLVQLNTDLKSRGFEFTSSDPYPQGSIEEVRETIKARLIKGGIRPERLEDYYAVIQKQIDSIESLGA